MNEKRDAVLNRLAERGEAVASKPLGEATDHELLRALGLLWGLRESEPMTRSAEVECHHQILYAIGALNDIRVHMEANAHRGTPTDWRKVVEEVLEAIRCLNVLVIYARTGRGGTSALREH